MASRSTSGSTVDLQQHPLLTTMGLLVEAHAGLVRTMERHLEAECGLSMQWFEVLLRLVRTPGHRLRMSDLAAQTTLSASGLTRAVDRLEAAGLVERQACPTDRRSSYAALTELGRTRILAALPVHLAQLQEVFESVFSREELATFTEMARRLRDSSNPCAAAASAPGGLEP
jgi:MarR family transcriptional regulator, 2-MHQ and catechol-resistance regulon repressor